MTDVDREGKFAVRRLSGRKSAKRISLLLTASLAALFTFTSPIAFQDVASLLTKDRATARWATISMPAAVAPVEAATISTGDSQPGGAGLKAHLDAETAVFHGSAETPDARVRGNVKGARVLTLAPRMMEPPRGFSAGSIMERQSMLGSRVIGGGERIRTAFSKIAPSVKDAMVVASNFKLKGVPDALRGGTSKTPDTVMMASLAPAVEGTNALGYAGTADDGGGRAPSLFEKILKDTPKAFIPPISGRDHSWAARPLPASTLSSAEQKCLATGLYFEARGESTMGQAAVGQVILNRVRNPAFPNTICGVVYQNRNWRNRCQFSFACDGIADRVRDTGAWARAKRVAEEVTKGEIWINEVGSATHYHANYVRPRWASAMERVDKIGRHIFYRTFNGGW